MAELNKDGLVVGQEVDFTTIMRVNRERAKGVEHDNINKPEIRNTGDADLPVVQKTERPKKTKKSQS